MAIKCLNVEHHSWDICHSLLPYDCVDALCSFIGETVNFLEDYHIASCLKDLQENYQRHVFTAMQRK
jgi:hypothetical protein